MADDDILSTGTTLNGLTASTKGLESSAKGLPAR